MGKKLSRHAHDDRDYRSGRYRKSNPCDACGKPVGTAYYTDEEVCGNTDGPGFFLCDRARCCKNRDLDTEGRRALYTAQRAINDAADRSVPVAENSERNAVKRAEFDAKRAAIRVALRATAGEPEPDSECAECGKRFWSADGHPTLALCRECWQPDAGIRCLEERIAKAAAMIARCAVTDGVHHKQWCLDQALRAMFTEEQYAAWVAEMAANPDRDPWDTGIAP